MYFVGVSNCSRLWSKHTSHLPTLRAWQLQLSLAFTPISLPPPPLQEADVTCNRENHSDFFCPLPLSSMRKALVTRLLKWEGRGRKINNFEKLFHSPRDSVSVLWFVAWDFYGPRTSCPQEVVSRCGKHEIGQTSNQPPCSPKCGLVWTLSSPVYSVVSIPVTNVQLISGKGWVWDGTMNSRAHPSPWDKCHWGASLKVKMLLRSCRRTLMHLSHRLCHGEETASNPLNDTFAFQLWSAAVGAAHGRGPVPWHWRARCGLRGSSQQAHSAHSIHLPRAVCQAHERYLRAPSVCLWGPGESLIRTSVCF